MHNESPTAVGSFKLQSAADTQVTPTTRGDGEMKIATKIDNR